MNHFEELLQKYGKTVDEIVFAYEGLWERMTLFFMYVPFLYMAVQNF